MFLPFNSIGMRHRCTIIVGAGVLAAGLLALAGCARGCQEPSPFPDSFPLAFGADTVRSNGTGFRRAEVRSAYLVRYATTDLQQPLDTLHANTGRGGGRLFLDVYYPSSSDGRPGFDLRGSSSRSDAHSFRLLVPAAGRTYDITAVVLEYATGPGKCPEYRVTRREATINGQRREALTSIPELSK